MKTPFYQEYSDIQNGNGVAFPATSPRNNTYILLQSAGGYYQMLALGDSSGYKYGPFAYQLQPAPDSAPVMPRPSLFTKHGSIFPKYFTKGNRLIELDVNADGLVHGNIETIHLYSLPVYLSDHPEVRSRLQSNNAIKGDVNSIPIRWISIFDAQAGKQRLYARHGETERFMPIHSVDTFNKTNGILYRTDRWFYEILFFVSANSSSENIECTSLPAINGIFEISITGSATTATWEQEIVMPKGRSKFSWKLNSIIDVGEITTLSIRAVSASITDSPCTSFMEIRVIDLRDTVYVTSFRKPRYWFLSLPEVPVFESDVEDDEWLSELWGLGTTVLDGTLLEVIVSPWSTGPVVEMVYGYVLPKEGRWSEAVETCASVGGQVASWSSALQLAENGLDICDPVFIGNDHPASEIFYRNVDYNNQNFAQVKQLCYHVHKVNSSCYNASGRAEVVLPSTLTTVCKPLCVGVQPTTTQMQALFDAPLAAGPVALRVTFAYAVTAPSGQSDNSSGPSNPPTPTPSPTPVPTSPPNTPSCENYPETSPPSPNSQKIQYTFVESNQYYARINVSNSIVPLTGVAVFNLDWQGHSGSWVNFVVENGYWKLNNMQNGFRFPIYIQLSAAGYEPLVDKLMYHPGTATVEGNVQFD